MKLELSKNFRGEAIQSPLSLTQRNAARLSYARLYHCPRSRRIGSLTSRCLPMSQLFGYLFAIRHLIFNTIDDVPGATKQTNTTKLHLYIARLNHARYMAPYVTLERALLRAWDNESERIHRQKLICTELAELLYYLRLPRDLRSPQDKTTWETLEIFVAQNLLYAEHVSTRVLPFLIAVFVPGLVF